MRWGCLLAAADLVYTLSAKLPPQVSEGSPSHGMSHLLSAKLELPASSLSQKHCPPYSVPARLYPLAPQYAVHLVLVTSWLPMSAKVMPVRARALRLSE